jgi:Clp amino terminal domain, pathogenicity island component
VFKGTEPGVMAVYGLAGRAALRLDSGFVGGEHLLLALSSRPTATGDLVRAHGCTPDAIEASVVALGGIPAAVAASLEAASSLGVEVDDEVAATLRPTRPVHRILPLGWRRGRQWCDQARPRLPGDAEAAYEAALFLALARWHRTLGEHHLAEVLVRWSRGSRMVAERSGASPSGALHALVAAHSPRRATRMGHVHRARSLALTA